MQFKEIEFKYKAIISLPEFKKFCANKSPERFVFAAGDDHFFSKVAESGSFCRHRYGPDMNQLTFKRKTTDTDNYVRTEHNVDLSASMSENAVSAFLKEFGYTYARTLFKNCWVYNYKWYTLVYYIVYDDNKDELGRFIEIEMKEDADWNDQQHAWNELLVLEKLFKNTLGTSSDKRISESLYEMFVEQHGQKTR